MCKRSSCYLAILGLPPRRSERLDVQSLSSKENPYSRVVANFKRILMKSIERKIYCSRRINNSESMWYHVLCIEKLSRSSSSGRAISGRAFHLFILSHSPPPREAVSLFEVPRTRGTNSTSRRYHHSETSPTIFITIRSPILKAMVEFWLMPCQRAKTEKAYQGKCMII